MRGAIETVVVGPATPTFVGMMYQYVGGCRWRLMDEDRRRRGWKITGDDGAAEELPLSAARARRAKAQPPQLGYDNNSIIYTSVLLIFL
jgi:hypothetical protein